MIRFALWFLSLASVFSFHANRAYAVTPADLVCSNLFGPPPEDPSQIGLISKYGANIERLEILLKEIEANSKKTPTIATQEGHRLANVIAKEANGEAAIFYRLFHIALRDSRIWYSREFYTAFLEDMFAESHVLTLQVTNRATSHAFFNRLLENGFRFAVRREERDAWKSAFRPILYYASQFWLPVPGNLRAETTLRTNWKEKAAQNFKTDAEAQEFGHNLASHIKKNARDVQTYVRFYYIVMNQFRVSRTAAFYRGLFDDRFARTFIDLDSRSQNLLLSGLAIAEKSRLDKTSTPSTLAPLSIPTPFEKPVPPDLSTLQGFDLVRAMLRLRPLVVTQIVDTIVRESHGSGKTLTDLLELAIQERRTDTTTLNSIIANLFRATTHIIVQRDEQNRIWKLLDGAEIAPDKYGIWLWGTSGKGKSEEDDLRSYFRQFRANMNFAMKEAGSEAAEVARRRGLALEKYIRQLAKVDINAPALTLEQSIKYARLIYIAFTEPRFIESEALYHGLLNANHIQTFAKLTKQDQELVDGGFEFMVERTGYKPVTAQTIVRNSRATNKAVSPSEKGTDAIYEFVSYMNENAFKGPRAQTELGREFAKVITLSANGDPATFIKLVTVAIQANRQPLHPNAQLTFKLEVLQAAHAIGISNVQIEFLRQVLTLNRSEAVDRLEKAGWLEN